ncbi:unnamed protein product [Mytilus edulis]|uniref:Uncharacterized protein n=1 Tax=Mytilus edulis TaxID=6550 RepID=A0A8S3SWS4_MYTED|nr:unnamed protein product [Mytilus edulis]
MRKCYDVWSRNGKPTNPDDKSYQDRVNTRKEFKKQVKVEQARERDREKQEILEARTRDRMEGYKLQPQKSVAIHIQPKPTKNSCEPEQYQLGKDPMPNVTKSTHLGIIRTPSMRQNIESNVEENVKKARRSAYALFGSGFHGENGLDPESLIHLYKTYISPVLLYGIELLTTKSAHLETLEKFQKKMLKQILSVPMSTPDPSVYILTGILPVEA